VQKRIAEGPTDLSTAIAAATQKPNETDAEYLAHFEDPMHMSAEELEHLHHSHMDMALVP
jgi:cytochrome c oxidase subunit 2